MALSCRSALAQQPAATEPAVTQDVFKYTMTGRVRVLLFWFSKSNVGGGHIAFTERPAASPGTSVGEAEVLFGSDPERVPGRINRWGYGHELAYWTQDRPDAAPCLQSTLFEGFIRHSNEESLTQVRQSDSSEKSGKQYWFDGIESRVTAIEAETSVWQFYQTTDFDYRNIHPAQEAYRKRRQQGPPDKTSRLVNNGRLYSQPYGFLTAMRRLLYAVSDAYLSGDVGWYKANYEAAYGYNAKAYRVRATRVTYLPDLPPDWDKSKPSGLDAAALQRLAEADFDLNTVPPTSPRRFSILFPLQGTYRATPIRIVDHPRWWLEVDLKLTGHERAWKNPWSRAGSPIRPPSLAFAAPVTMPPHANLAMTHEVMVSKIEEGSHAEEHPGFKDNR